MLISVITINFNGVNRIEQTIKSVLEQTYNDLEYIVIDGGSTDGSIDIIRQYDDEIDYLIIEPDDGISDAMNKGLKNSTGEYIVFLHSDDVFENSESLLQASKCIDTSQSIIACDVYYGQQNIRYSNRGFNFWLNFKTGLMHQGVLCPRKVFEQIGDFDNQFKIAMDYDFFLRAYHNGIILVKCPVVLSSMGDTGLSSKKDWQSLSNRFNEEKMVHNKNCRSFFMILAYKIYWPAYICYWRIKYILNKLNFRNNSTW